MKYKSNCPICRSLRQLPSNLNELALVCVYLDNFVRCVEGDSKRIARTRTIGEWLQLASRLEEVKIDAWKFECDALICRPASEAIDSDSAHYTLYATALTRFIYVANALEETYRFVDSPYQSLADSKGISQKIRPISSSIKAAILIDMIPQDNWALHLSHKVENFKGVFSRYLEAHPSELSGMKFADKSGPAYALHLVRNLRNHVAHGAFPLVANPDYAWNVDFDREDAIQLLNQSSRLAAMYMQMLLSEYNSGFNSTEYLQLDKDSPEGDFFLKNCTNEYIRTVHIDQKFSLASAFDYYLRPWETA